MTWKFDLCGEFAFLDKKQIFLEIVTILGGSFQNMPALDVYIYTSMTFIPVV